MTTSRIGKRRKISHDEDLDRAYLSGDDPINPLVVTGVIAVIFIISVLFSIGS